MTWELLPIPKDCVGRSYRLSEFALVYADPPFNSGRDYYFNNEELAFSDKWISQESYALWISCMVRETLWPAVKPGGSLVLHIDPRQSAAIRTALDMEELLQSEIVWRYRRWPTKTRNFQRVHDVLLRFVKPGAEPTWNQLYEPLADSTTKTWGTSKQDAVVRDGRRIRSSKTDETSKGVPMGDVWDISIVAPNAKERTGYPTQKPERLLERLILALTNPGDLVLDPCCGSGTTVAVAHRLGRHGVGADISDIALRVTRERLEEGCAFDGGK